MTRHTSNAFHLVLGLLIGGITTAVIHGISENQLRERYSERERMMTQQFVKSVQEKSNILKTLSHVDQTNKDLISCIQRLRRVVDLVEKPTARTTMEQIKDAKHPAIVTIPPNPKHFRMFETYIELKPKPHFAKKEINLDRWNQIWNCNCPLTCDCWIGLPCISHSCRAKHNK